MISAGAIRHHTLIHLKKKKKNKSFSCSKICGSSTEIDFDGFVDDDAKQSNTIYPKSQRLPVYHKTFYDFWSAF